MNKKDVEYTIIRDTSDSAVLILEDGSISSYYHNGDNVVVEYYQDRLTPDMLDCEDIPWDRLSEGKMYVQDLMEEDMLGESVIQSMLWWMYMSPNVEINFIRRDIDWSNIKTLIKP
jgi:hypothetical protein